MSQRLISVTAYTTLDYVEAVTKGLDFERESVGVANATSDRTDPDCVEFQLELDNVTEEYLPQHMDTLELTPEQARALAADLEKHADRVEAAE